MLIKNAIVNFSVLLDRLFAILWDAWTSANNIVKCQSYQSIKNIQGWEYVNVVYTFTCFYAFISTLALDFHPHICMNMKLNMNFFLMSLSYVQ